MNAITARCKWWIYKNHDYSTKGNPPFPASHMSCFRCGRRGHWVSNCYASTDVRGAPIDEDDDDCDDDSDEESESDRETKHAQPRFAKKRKLEQPTAGVYALVTSRGMQYVGKSDDVNGRINVHRQGNGARCLEGSGGNFTKVPLLTHGQSHDLESWERDETLTRMLRHGIDNVRGWMFVSKTLSEEQRESAFNQVCERFDLCRKCGRNSHFASACFAKSKAQWAT
jgi:hypothetical protein